MDKWSRVILPIVLTVVLLLTCCSNGSEQSGSQVKKPAPDFQLESLDGQVVSLSGLRGSPVMLNFWATWCPPCRSEMPFIQQIYEEWSDEGLVLLAINIGESSGTVQDFMRSNNISMPVLLDTSREVAQRYGITGIPATFFIDKDGIIQNRVVGAFTNKESIEKHLGSIIP